MFYKFSSNKVVNYYLFQIPLAGGAFALVLLTLVALSLLCKKKEEVKTPAPKKEGEPKESKKRD